MLCNAVVIMYYVHVVK